MNADTLPPPTPVTPQMKRWPVLVGAAVLAVIVVAALSRKGATTDTGAPDVATRSTPTLEGEFIRFGKDFADREKLAFAFRLHDHDNDGTLDREEVLRMVAISLADGGSTAEGDGVSIDGDTVTITAAGTYRISGTLTDGQIVVDAADADVRLVLDGVDITSSTSAAILVEQANDTIIWSADGSDNHVAGGTTTATSDEDAPNAAIYSRDDLALAGAGSLTVDGTTADAITAKDDLVIAGGAIAVTAVDDGIRGKDSVTVAGGTVTIEAGGDGITSDNTTTAADETDPVGTIAISGGDVTIAAQADAIDAAGDIAITGGSLSIAAGDDGVHADGRVSIAAGTIDITQSYEGVEGAIIEISGGALTIVASDDGINVGGGNDGSGAGGPAGGDTFTTSGDRYAAISGGTIVVDAAGDGIDIGGALTITGGTIVVDGPTEQMNGALDVDGAFTVTDAVLVAAGSAGMAESPDDSEQAVLAMQFDTAQAAGTVVQIATEDGEVVAAFQAAKQFESLVYTSPDLVAGTTYVVSIGGTIDGTTLAGLLVDGTATGGDQIGTVTA